MIDVLKNLNPVPPIKKAWRWVKDRWPWGRRQVTVAPPPVEEIELVPIPPPEPVRVVVEIVQPSIIPPVFEPSPVVMSVDTQIQRMSVLATRYGRLPFGRRFTTTIPDGTLAQADRQILGGVYAGILAGEAEEEDTPDVMIKRIVRHTRVRPARLPLQMIGRLNEYNEWS